MNQTTVTTTTATVVVVATTDNLIIVLAILLALLTFFFLVVCLCVCWRKKVFCFKARDDVFTVYGAKKILPFSTVAQVVGSTPTRNRSRSPIPEASTPPSSASSDSDHTPSRSPSPEPLRAAAPPPKKKKKKRYSPPQSVSSTISITSPPPPTVSIPSPAPVRIVPEQSPGGVAIQPYDQPTCTTCNVPIHATNQHGKCVNHVEHVHVPHCSQCNHPNHCHGHHMTNECQINDKPTTAYRSYQSSQYSRTSRSSSTVLPHEMEVYSIPCDRAGPQYVCVNTACQQCTRDDIAQRLMNSWQQQTQRARKTSGAA